VEIRACPNCGNTNIRQSTYQDGGFLGRQGFAESLKYVCDKCLYQGMPIYFDSEKKYQKFINELEQEKNNKK